MFETLREHPGRRNTDVRQTAALWTVSAGDCAEARHRIPWTQGLRNSVELNLGNDRQAGPFRPLV